MTEVSNSCMPNASSSSNYLVIFLQCVTLTIWNNQLVAKNKQCENGYINRLYILRLFEQGYQNTSKGISVFIGAHS